MSKQILITATIQHVLEDTSEERAMLRFELGLNQWLDEQGRDYMSHVLIEAAEDITPIGERDDE